MNTAISNDVNMLAQEALLHKAALKKWEIKMRKRAAAHLAFFHNHEALLVELEAQDLELNFIDDADHQRLSFSGNKQRLEKIWGILRRHGFKTESRPEAGAISFTGWWKHQDGSSFFMWFTSTQCVRKQVGTKMVEQPIYETVCTEQIGHE